MQLTHAYNEVCERNDQSVFHYGFVQDTDPPLLAALDTPSGNLYDGVSYTEADYGRPPSSHPLANHMMQSDIEGASTNEVGTEVILAGQAASTISGNLHDGVRHGKADYCMLWL